MAALASTTTPFRLTASEACARLLPALSSAAPPTHAARAAALLLAPCGGNTWVDDGAGRLVVDSRRWYVSVLCIRRDVGPATASRLAAAARAAVHWSADDAASIAALSDDDAVAAAVAMRHLGRTVANRVPCATLQLDAAAWAAAVGAHGDVTRPLQLDALARESRLPASYEFGQLTSADVSVCASTWAYADARTVAALSAQVAALPSACVRVAGSGELAAWILMRYDGSLGVLFTQPPHRGRGLARAVMRLALVRLWRWRSRLLLPQSGGGSDDAAADDNGVLTASVDASLSAADAAALAALILPYVHVADGNAASAQLMASLGFTEVEGAVGRATWVVGGAPAPRFVLRPLRAHATDEWAQLTALVNTSYRQDDAFFVNHPRTPADGSELRGLGERGTFFVGYRVAETAAWPSGLGLDCGDPEPLARGGTAPPPFSSPSATSSSTAPLSQAANSPRDKPTWESDELFVAAYVSIEPDGDEAARGGGGSVASLSLLTISPSLKRLGCAQRVLDIALAIAAGAGAAQCEVYIVSVKPWLLRFYERNGFKVVGEVAWPADALGQLLMPCHFHRARRLLTA